MGRYVFKLPDVGEGTADAELVAWHVAVGDRVEEDQNLADVMTDKATVEMTSPVAGVVSKLNGAPGEMLAVGAPLVEFDVEGPGNAEPSSPAERGRGTAAEGGGGGGAGRLETASGQAHLAHTDEEAESLARRPAPPQSSAAPATAPPQAGEQGSGTSAGTYVFKLPDVGEGTAEAELVAWRVAVGDVIEEDQPLADVMTDKATVELTSPVAGVVAALHGEPGGVVAVGSPLVRLQVEWQGNVSASDRPAPSVAPAAAGAPPPPRAPRAGEEPKAPTSGSSPMQRSEMGEVARPQGGRDGGGAGRPTAVPRISTERPLASPAVRKRAHDLGVQLQFVPGTGPGGRISHEDLDAHVRSPSPPGEGQTAQRSGWGTAPKTAVTDVKIIGMRRRIAQQMQESKRHIPHITYVEEIDATELDALRLHLNATKQKDRPKLTLLPFFIRALVKVLPEHPQINARYDDEAGVLHQFDGVHVGVATQGPNGLLVPVVRHAETLDLWGAATEVARVTGAAKDGSAKREELTGSTITLTSLGPLGGVVHTPIVNWPEVAIVGPNKLVERPVVRDGAVQIRKMMNLSSSFDHRIVDGWDAATFVQKLKGLLEHPAALFVE